MKENAYFAANGQHFSIFLLNVRSYVLVINTLKQYQKENSTNLDFSTCDTRPSEKNFYDVVNRLALLLTSDAPGLWLYYDHEKSQEKNPWIKSGFKD